MSVNLTSNESFTRELINHLDKFLGKNYGLLVDSDKISVSDFDMSLTNTANICDVIDAVCLSLFGTEYTFNYKKVNGVLICYNFN